jgi:hypothetical protein
LDVWDSRQPMSAQVKHYLGIAAESCVKYFAPRLVLFALVLLLVVETLVPMAVLALGLAICLALALLPRKKNLRSATLPSEAFVSPTAH